MRDSSKGNLRSGRGSSVQARRGLEPVSDVGGGHLAVLIQTGLSYTLTVRDHPAIDSTQPPALDARKPECSVYIA